MRQTCGGGANIRAWLRPDPVHAYVGRLLSPGEEEEVPCQGAPLGSVLFRRRGELDRGRGPLPIPNPSGATGEYAGRRADRAHAREDGFGMSDSRGRPR